VVFLAAALMAAITLATSPAAIRADVTKVIGGGVATFDAFPRLVSYWGAEATLQAGGTAAGTFTCMVVDSGVVLGTFDSSTVNGDGSITLEGSCSVFFVNGTVAEDIDLRVTFWEGGPNVGRFLFWVPGLPEPGDAETVLFGGIQFRQ
jgi:hypothetical protein